MKDHLILSKLEVFQQDIDVRMICPTSRGMVVNDKEPPSIFAHFLVNFASAAVPRRSICVVSIEAV